MDGKRMTATFAGAVGCALAICSYSALAQVPCGPVNQVEAALVQGGSKLTADLRLATDSAPMPMRLFVNPATGKWVLVTYPHEGAACLVLVGDGYQEARLPGSPA